MLIRFAAENDLPTWQALSKEYDPFVSKISADFSKWYQGFIDYMARKIEQSEAIIAIDNATGNCKGAIAFSRSNNNITFFAISLKAEHEQTAEKLLESALSELNTNADISINLPDSSFGQLKTDRDFFERNDFNFVMNSIVDGCPMAKLVKKPTDKHQSGDFWQMLDKLVAECEIIIDRPKGTAHPRYPAFIYELDYSYLKGTKAMDGGGIDVWRGSDPARKLDAIMCIVDINKRDSEIKLLIGCTEEEKEIVYEAHNKTELMKGILIRRDSDNSTI